VNSSNYIIIAKIGKPHGLKGEFNFHLFSYDVDDLDYFFNLYIKKDNNYILLPKIAFKISKNHIIAKVEGYDSREDIKTLCNKDIYIKKEDLPKLDKGEYFHIDLIDCHCFYNNSELGVVKDIVNYGSTDIFEVESPSRKIFYIPFLNEKIAEINIEKKSIYFKDLEGFI